MILVDRIVALRCRSPCGERGLKFVLTDMGEYVRMVAPRAGSVG